MVRILVYNFLFSFAKVLQKTVTEPHLLDLSNVLGQLYFSLIHSIPLLFQTNEQAYWFKQTLKQYLKGFVVFDCRFCPCFFFYLCSTIPAIWLLELDRRDRFVKKENSTHATDTNSTKNVGLPNFYGVCNMLFNVPFVFSSFHLITRLLHVW